MLMAIKHAEGWASINSCDDTILYTSSKERFYPLFSSFTLSPNTILQYKAVTDGRKWRNIKQWIIRKGLVGQSPVGLRTYPG